LIDVQVNLMGALKPRTPPGREIRLTEGSTIDDALEKLGISAVEVQIVLVNGRPQSDRSTPLSTGDEMTVLPPVGGG
jgi:sulfur carrier protein ThiS